MIAEIVTPDKTVYSGSVTLVSVPGVMGAFEILNNHAPIVSALGKGQIRIVEDNADHSEQLFDVESGIVEVKSNKVNVLIEK
ncbi:MAG: ATP synthase F1 subunit epsilon [Salinivirgaceae bacterium]|nr:ATP synthase F1 subunit epsilon [Salinivirgaceae bacterium]